MKWIKLDGKKDPPANTPVDLWVVTKDVEWWTKGFLSRIGFSSKGKQYVFSSSHDASIEIEDATHYMVIEKPKE